MNYASVYDELDAAIGAMMANTQRQSGTLSRKASWGTSDGSELTDLLQIASELCSLPRPDFKTRLKTELEWVAAARPLSSARRPEAGAGPEILPSLFGHGFGTYPMRRINFAASLAVHAVAILLVAVLGIMAFKTESKTILPGLNVVELSDYVPPPGLRQPHGGGGGGDADRLKASTGTLPKASSEQLAPPTTTIQNEHSKLMVEPTIVAPSLQLPQTKQVGDPLSALMTPSDGRGVGSGIGSGGGGGVGAGNGPGFGIGTGGGYGGGVFTVGNGVTAPHVVYDPTPEYSLEARQAKYQGTVVLWAIIGPDGRPRDLRVHRSLGMGLDEKAMEAVRTWRFRPATKDGNPVAVQIEVEVNFHLY
ncbi:MAG TPA: energy transducer TonB [Candidatus Angelobacter sp.]